MIKRMCGSGGNMCKKDATEKKREEKKRYRTGVFPHQGFSHRGAGVSL